MEETHPYSHLWRLFIIILDGVYRTLVPQWHYGCFASATPYKCLFSQNQCFLRYRIVMLIPLSPFASASSPNPNPVFSTFLYF